MKDCHVRFINNLQRHMLTTITHILFVVGPINALTYEGCHCGKYPQLTITLTLTLDFSDICTKKFAIIANPQPEVNMQQMMQNIKDAKRSCMILYAVSHRQANVLISRSDLSVVSKQTIHLCSRQVLAHFP